jgi:hypothetical protein
MSDVLLLPVIPLTKAYIRDMRAVGGEGGHAGPAGGQLFRLSSRRGDNVGVALIRLEWLRRSRLDR